MCYGNGTCQDFREVYLSSHTNVLRSTLSNRHFLLCHSGTGNFLNFFKLGKLELPSSVLLHKNKIKANFSKLLSFSII